MSALIQKTFPSPNSFLLHPSPNPSQKFKHPRHVEPAIPPLSIRILLIPVALCAPYQVVFDIDRIGKYVIAVDDRPLHELRAAARRDCRRDAGSTPVAYGVETLTPGAAISGTMALFLAKPRPDDAAMLLLLIWYAATVTALPT